MKSFYVSQKGVQVEEIGAPRAAFDPPKNGEEVLKRRLEIALRRERSRAIRQQNRNRTGKI